MKVLQLKYENETAKIPVDIIDLATYEKVFDHYEVLIYINSRALFSKNVETEQEAIEMMNRVNRLVYPDWDEAEVITL